MSANWAGLVIVLLVLVSALGQGNYASITGIVTDSGSAVVPGVTVAIRNVDTDIARSVDTSESGDFTITNLAPGSYELSVEKTGFRRYRKDGIVLQVGQQLRSDVVLELGQVSESVQVTAEVAALNTESGTIKGDVIVREEIQDLPLDGRDFVDLAFLVPGVFPRAQGGQGSALAVNGARADSTNFYVDGFSNRNPRGAAAQARPNLNALQEFKMEVSGYSAEYGRMAGGVMNMVLRTGTNRYHGDVFEYVRNNVIDARSFFDAGKLKLNRHQFGATFHGPVWLPKLYDGHSRTFFMLSWESYRQILGQTRLAQVPSLLERGGDFSESLNQTAQRVAVSDPLASNAAFPGNRIPVSRFDPTASKLLGYYPLPNRPGLRNNYFSTASDNDRWDSILWKIDHRIDDHNSVAFRYQIRYNNTSNPFAGGDLGFGNLINDDRSLLGLDYTHLFTPTFLVELRAGYSRNTTRERAVLAGVDFAEQLGIPGSTKEPELLAFPLINVQSYTSLGNAANQPVQYHVTDILSGFKFTWVKSRHVRKWGLDYSRVRINQPFFNNNRGTYAIQDRWTQHPIGDFLLGTLNNTSRTVGWTRNYMRTTSLGMFYNEDWKATPTLTLNLGMRYEVDYPPTDRYDRMANFVVGLNQVVVADKRSVPGIDQRIADAGLEGRVTFAADAGFPRSLVYPDFTNFAPRVGFAWRAFGSDKTVIRGGYGIFYTGHLLNPIRTALMTAFPFSVNETYSRQNNRPDLVTFSNPFPTERIAFAGINNANGYDPHPPTGYLQSYNFTVERDAGGGMVVEAGFVGSKGTHLGRQYDINQPIRTMEAYLAGVAVAQLRPVPALAAINYYQFGVNSIYNAGQISLRKRARGGTFYRFNYSWSKSIDNASQISGTADGGFAGAQNPRDFKTERARSDWDRSHLVTAAFSWQLPVGRRRRFLADARGIAEGLLGGWQFSGTANFASGAPFTVTTAGIDANLGETSRPNRLGSGRLEDGAGAGRRGVDYPWFNLTGFERVPRCGAVAEGCGASPNGFLPFQFGNSGRNILEGPGVAYMNLALMKNFRFGEGKNFQFRFESFNIFNRPNFQLPNIQFNSINGGLITG
ncbi:MAG: carboxypeptidase regulatory-like domain-containing protein, partial [Bryobacteraceae bacterium]